MRHSPDRDRRAVARVEREYDRGAVARVRAFARGLGPGLVTGASDDDPSGIATYSQAGAGFGFGLLWTALLTLPLMAAVQIMCARIGIVASDGLAAVLRRHYPRGLLWCACLLLLVANTVNIAADLAGMAAAAELILGVPHVWLIPVFAAGIMALLAFASYARMTRVLKWLTLTLVTYIVAALFARPDVGDVLRGTFSPRFQPAAGYLLTVVALLGTTISPYLFFWQTAQNAEQEEHLVHRLAGRPRRAIQRELRGARTDVVAGMFFSNLIMYFIILTTGATLHQAGITHLQTADQAAAALRPLAGPAAEWLFALGLIGTGMLAVPVLAGSAAYAVAEAGAWRRGLDAHPRSAHHFYAVMALALLTGMVLAFAGVPPIRLLFASAVLNGLLAPPLIWIILIVANDARVMGAQRNGRLLNILGVIAAVLMSGAALALLASWRG